MAAAECQLPATKLFIVCALNLAATAGANLKVGFEGTSGDCGESAKELFRGATSFGSEFVLSSRALAEGSVGRRHDALLLKKLEEGIERSGAQRTTSAMTVLIQNAIAMAGSLVEDQENVESLKLANNVTKALFCQQAHPRVGISSRRTYGPSPAQYIQLDISIYRISIYHLLC